MSEPQTARDAILKFYADCGVTAHLAATPQDRFATALAPPVPVDAPADAAADDAFFDDDAPPHEGYDAGYAAHGAPAVIGAFGEMAEPAPASEVMEAREAARQAPTLEALHRAMIAFDGCPLKATARQACPGEGPIGAPLMFVGEAPGREEDEAGRPFVGRSGKLLNKMIAAIGLKREEVYITNVIPWRPPGNRTPSPIETATCEVFVRREIALVGPKLLVPLGGPAAKTLLKNDAGIMRQRGRWTRYVPESGEAIDALAMFHPAYLLRTPAEKRRAWQDLLALRGRLETMHGFPPL